MCRISLCVVASAFVGSLKLLKVAFKQLNHRLRRERELSSRQAIGLCPRDPRSKSAGS